MSTKCQYQIENSNPIKCLFENWFKFIRINIINKNKRPIITWIPWNPVDTKKIELKILSEIENNEVKYSNIWHKIKLNPKNLVNNNLNFDDFILFLKSL